MTFRLALAAHALGLLGADSPPTADRGPTNTRQEPGASAAEIDERRYQALVLRPMFPARADQLLAVAESR